MKNRTKLRITIVILIIIAIIAIVLIWPKSGKEYEIKIIKEIKDYGYVLEDNETAIHQQYFNELVDILKEEAIDDEKYAELITQLFISDFYNLDNKITKNDIGGIQYVNTNIKDNMVLKAKDTIYKYIENNIDSNREQKLPIVTEVAIDNIEQVEFEYGSETDDKAYELAVKWTYKEDLEYQDEALVTIIHEGKKLSIAELK